MPVVVDILSQVWSWEYSSLPLEVRDEARKALLDSIGVGILGFEREERVKRFASLAYPIDKGSLVLGAWWRSSPSMAALVNGFAIHSLEYDDWLRQGFVHAGSVIVPAALALGEGKVSWEKLLEAVVIGYEVAARFGRAFGRDHYSKWHTTATAGSLGAAAAASRVLGLSLEEAPQALAISSYYASGLWGFISGGSSIKPFSSGHAAFLGVTSSLMARNGMKTNLRALEDERGFCKNMAPECRLEESLDPGWNYAILLNGYKFFPTCRHTHTALTAAIMLSDGVNPEEVREVRVDVFEEAAKVAGIREPKNVDQARFSLPYLVALALIYGRVGLDELERGLGDSRVRALEKKVNVVVNPELSTQFPERQPSIVEVRGEVSKQERVDYPPGDPENPANLDQIYRKVVYEVRASPVVAALYDRLRSGKLGEVVSIV